jgi:hypothetical protein
MNDANDALLETDRLDELLETPAQAQPVVVVQYRNRGVPTWIFLPLLFVVPMASIVVYHRLVVERYHVQSAQADSLLAREIKDELASLPLVRNDPPSTTDLPGLSGATTIVGDATPFLTMGADSFPPITGSSALTNTIEDHEDAKASSTGTTGLTPKPSATVGQTQAVVADHTAVAPTVAPAAKPDSSATAPDKAPKITLRTLLPSPFADDTVSPVAPTPRSGSGLGDDVDQPAKSPADRAVDRSAGGDQQDQDKGDTAGNAATGGRRAAEPLKPLPTKEESLRQIQEEAAMREAELLAHDVDNSTDLKTQRRDEQMRFREELRDVLRTQGFEAGPEIDSLAKRYGYDLPREKYAKAHQVWRYSRTSQKEKVRQIRLLELPETVILDFLSDDIHPKVKSRNGPRNSSEVRVLAAKQLLKYPLPGPGAPVGTANDSSVATPPAASQSFVPKRVVSTPR